MAEVDTFLHEDTNHISLKEALKSPEAKEISAFVLSQFMAFFVFMALSQMYPLFLQKHAGLTDQQALDKWALIVSIYTFGTILTRILAGYFIEKAGRKVMTIIAFASTMAATLGLLASTNTAILAILFLIIRSANNIFSLNSRSLLSDLETKYKGFFNSVVSMAGRTGNLIGTIALGAILQFLPAMVMILFPVIVLAFGLVAFVLLYQKDGQAEIRHKRRREQAKSHMQKKRDYKSLRTFTFWFFLVAFMLFGLSAGFTTPLLSLYGKNIIHLNETTVGTFLGIAQLSFILATPIVGMFISKYKRLLVTLPFISSLLLASNFFLMYLIPQNLAIYVIFLFIRNFAQAMFFPVVITILTAELPKDQFAFLYSLISTAFFVGIAVTSYFTSSIYAIDFKLPFLCSFIVMLVLSAYIVLLLFRRVKQKNGIVGTFGM
ncbi:MAG: MFS transporter [Candidatus Heimdallarchaeaceae archaeon]